jgi:hypothetical protein
MMPIYGMYLIAKISADWFKYSCHRGTHRIIFSLSHKKYIRISRDIVFDGGSPLILFIFANMMGRMAKQLSRGAYNAESRGQHPVRLP